MKVRIKRKKGGMKINIEMIGKEKGKIEIRSIKKKDSEWEMIWMIGGIMKRLKEKMEEWMKMRIDRKIEYRIEMGGRSKNMIVKNDKVIDDEERFRRKLKIGKRKSEDKKEIRREKCEIERS